MRVTVRLLAGDCRSLLPTLVDGSVQCVVTSPPYFGLRDYQVAGQIGLESSVDAYVAELVAVFREVRRVLHPTGTVWCNLGDSYVNHSMPGGGDPTIGTRNIGASRYSPTRVVGLKPKDLIGVPWLVAKALRAPYYAGRIPREMDRVWLAAMIDAEGTICGWTHKRKDNGSTRTGVHVMITNSNMPLLDNAHRIWPTSRSDHNAHGTGHLGILPTRRWIAHNVDDKSALMRELYPYLIAKRKQSLLAYTLFEMSRVAKRTARTGEAEEIKAKRAWIMHALSRLNHSEHVDIPNWCIEPPSLYEQGYYLRSEITWAKKAPMPESVTDRPTSATEKVFLLTKSARYFYDAVAVAELSVAGHGSGNGDRRDARLTYGGRGSDVAYEPQPTRNLRNFWLLGPAPFSAAHFATFPPALVEPCIKAGTSEKGCCASCGAPWVRVVERGERAPHVDPSALDRYGNGDAGVHRKIGGQYQKWLDENPKETTGWEPSCACDAESIPCTVLDPFAGAGTVSLVAERLGRDSIGMELNAEYVRMAEKRIQDDCPMFTTVEVS